MVSAQGGSMPPLLWAEQVPTDATGSALAVAVHGAVTLAVIGPDPGQAGASELRAHDTRTGELLWRRAALALPGQALVDLEAARERAFVASAAGGSAALAVRSRDVSDGLNEWGLFTYLPASSVSVNDLFLGGPRVFIVGSADDHRMVRAFDAADGAILWDDLPYEDDTGSRVEVASAAMTDDSRLVVAGSRQRTPDAGNSGIFVRVYRARDGELLWDAEAGSTEITVRGLAGSVEGTLVVAGTESSPDTGDPGWVVHAFDGETGATAWSDAPYRLGSSAEGIVHDAGAGIVYIAGWVSGARTVPLVRAHDAATGELLWEGGGATVKEGSFRAVTLADGEIIAVGSGRMPGSDRSTPLIEALDPDTGESLWSRIDAAGDGRGTLHSVSVHRGNLAVGGRRAPRSGTALLHVYSLEDR